MKFFIYRDRKKQFRWKLVAKNGKKIAVAGESFQRRAGAQKSIVKLCDASTAPVYDLTLKKK